MAACGRSTLTTARRWDRVAVAVARRADDRPHLENFSRSTPFVSEVPSGTRPPARHVQVEVVCVGGPGTRKPCTSSGGAATRAGGQAHGSVSRADLQRRRRAGRRRRRARRARAARPSVRRAQPVIWGCNVPSVTTAPLGGARRVAPARRLRDRQHHGSRARRRRLPPRSRRFGDVRLVDAADREPGELRSVAGFSNELQSGAAPSVFVGVAKIVPTPR